MRKESSHIADYELVQQVLAEDGSARAALAQRIACIPGMLRAVTQRLGWRADEDELDDLLQDVLLHIWRRLGSFEGRSRLETWVYGFCIRRSYKALDRRRKRDQTLGSDWVLEPVDPASEIVKFDSDEFVFRCLARVGPPGSDILRLHLLDELTFHEIAQELGLPLGTVKTHYYKSIARLKDSLKSAVGGQP